MKNINTPAEVPSRATRIITLSIFGVVSMLMFGLAYASIAI